MSSYASNPFELIKPSIEAFKRCWLNLLLSILCMLGPAVVVVVLYAIISAASGGSAPAAVNVILFALGVPISLYGIMYFSWSFNKAVLAAVRGQKIDFKATLPTSWTDPLKLFWTQVVAGFLIILGFLALIIPGIFALAFWSYAPYVTVDTGEWGWAALKKSREIMRHRTWDTLGAIMLSSAVGIVAWIPFIGWLAYFVFAIVTIPLTYLRYVSLIELKKQPDWEAVPTNKWNYIVFIIGLLVGGQQNFTSFSELQKNSSPVELNQKSV